PPLAAPVPRIRRAARVRRVLPVAIHPRQARSARASVHPSVRRAGHRGRHGDRRRSRLARRGAPLPERWRMTVPLIEVDGLRKDFAVTRKTGVLRRARAVVHAVDGLTFSVERGAIVGYIGANGAGQSRAVKMLTGMRVTHVGKLCIRGRTGEDRYYEHTVLR